MYLLEYSSEEGDICGFDATILVREKDTRSPVVYCVSDEVNYVHIDLV